jgi:hypothetical protein
MNRYRYFDSLLVILGIASGLVGNYDSPAGQVSKIIPATYAFAIWAPIYLSGIYFAWWLVRKSQVDFGLGIHLLALSFFMSGLWVRVQSNNALELVVVASNLIVVLTQAHLLSKLEFAKRSEFLAVGLPSGTLAGWLTLATAVTYSDGLKISFGDTRTVAIFAAFAVGFAVCASKWIVPTATYRWTLIWGLVGIVVSQHTLATQVAIVAGVGAVLLSALICYSVYRSTQHAIPVGNR